MASTAEDNRCLDVREIDGEPFGHIMGALDDLPSDERLVLYNEFEPVPLYDVLDSRGFTHETTQPSEDEYRIVIEHA
jgi:uncharacterized protein (DUF2249 family)